MSRPAQSPRCQLGQRHTDIAIAAHNANAGGYEDSGSVYVFEGPFVRGAEYTLADAVGQIDGVIDDQLMGTGEGVWAPGDIDGDGLDDFVVGSPHIS